MIVLALDTATPCPAVALAGPSIDVARPLTAGRAVSENLLPEIERVLLDAGLTLRSIERIAALAGPGSFTGIRVGLATAWGLSRSLDLDLETMGTLEAAAESARGGGSARVRPALPAERGEIYLARYDLAGDRAVELEPPAVEKDPVAGEQARELFRIRAESPPEILPALACARAVSRRPGPPASNPRAIYVRLSPAEEPRGVSPA